MSCNSVEDNLVFIPLPKIGLGGALDYADKLTESVYK